MDRLNAGTTTLTYKMKRMSTDEVQSMYIAAHNEFLLDYDYKFQGCRKRGLLSKYQKFAVIYLSICPK